MRKQGRAIVDWARVRRVAEQGHVPTRREILTEPTSDALAYFNSSITGVLSLDIETLGREVSCIGFAASPELAIVFPTLSAWQRERYWPAVSALCGSRHEKVLHNGHYDTYWLRNHGVNVTNWRWDTMWMHHALDPADNHGLQYLASVYAHDYQAWKEDRGDDDKDVEGSLRDTRGALWEYNGRDALYTREVFEHVAGELERAGRTGFYHDHYSRLFDPLLGTMLHGVRVDADAQRATAERLREENSRVREELKALAGYELYAVEENVEWREPTEEERERLWRVSEKTGRVVFDKAAAAASGYAAATRGGLVGVKREGLKKDFSGVKLRRWFYEDLGLPKQTHVAVSATGKRRVVSVDETALKKLATRFPAKAGRSVALILKHREDKGEIDDLNEKWDADGRIRCQYSFNTEAGRFASRANPMRSGRNLQNVKRGEQRRSYLPDPGCVFLAVDGSQVEDRVVKMLCGSKRLVEMANLRPGQFDAHTYNAARIFHISEADVTGNQRAIGKMAVHAAQRGMMGQRLADRLLVEAGVVYSVAYCQKLIDAYLNDHHEIRDVYFPAVRKQLMETRRLTNTWGRVWSCRHEVLNEDVYRRGYNFGPQCCDAATEVLTSTGFVPFPKLTLRHLVAQWSQENGEITFVHPIMVHEFEYSGTLHLFEGKTHSLCVTPNHRQPYRTAHKKVFVKSAYALSTRPRVRLVTSGLYEGGGTQLGSRETRLLVAVQADATLRSKSVEWHFSKWRKILRLSGLLRDLGVRTTISNNTMDGTTYFRVSKTEPTMERILAFLSEEKEFSPLILHMSKESREVFLEELPLWDGKRYGCTAYCTTRERNAELVQAVCSLTGKRGIVHQVRKKSSEHSDLYEVYMTERDEAITGQKAKDLLHDGKVFCVTVPSGFFVSRRNGRTCVTGNSECNDLMVQWGYVAASEHIRLRGFKSRVNLLVHDELILSCPPDEIHEMAQVVVRSLERPRHYPAGDLVVPMVVSVGANWCDKREFTGMPSEAELTEEARRCLTANGISGLSR